MAGARLRNPEPGMSYKDRLKLEQQKGKLDITDAEINIYGSRIKGKAYSKKYI